MAAKKKSNPFFSFIKGVIVIILALFLAGYFVIEKYLDELPPIPKLDNYKRTVVTQVYSSDGRLIKTFQAYKYEHAAFNEIPKYLKDAVISTEDKNFYTHKGYDIFGIVRSIIVNTVNKRASQGASTITQQLARVLFLSNEKTFDRKIKELQLAARIEKTIPKDKILEMYLNNVYLGSGAYGVGAAASTYFNKRLSQLTLAECALIAGLPQAPSAYNPYKNLAKAEKRRNKVLKRMYIMNTITKKEYEAALKEKTVLKRSDAVSITNIAPYFIDYVLKELEDLGYKEEDITQGGYKITTTLDYDAQIAANEAIRKNLAAWKLTGKKQNAALFSFSPKTGGIIAYVGGKDYSYSQYDRVTQAVRPPGSSFKPFVYAAAIESGMTPTDRVEDTPVTIGDWSPHNYGSKYKGTMPLYKALAVSSNVVAVKLIQKVGVDAVIDMAKKLGITTKLNKDYTISLGSNGVRLYDMVIAYGAFANGGYRVYPYSVEKLETERGQVKYRANHTRIDKVLDENTAGIMTAMLRKVITIGTGRGADIGKPMGGKTGTTNENKDAWFIGYTPDIVTGVFIGNDDNRSIGLTGGSAPARIWKDMMIVASKPYGNSDFNYPPVDFTVNYSETVSEELIKEGEDAESDEEPRQNEEQPANENKSAPETFKSIPVQLNLQLNDKIMKSARKTESANKTESEVKIPQVQLQEKN